MTIDERDVSYEVFSGHGPGGQNKNRKLKCVRATHVPTGIVAVATRERSLRQNKKAALETLCEKIAEAAASASEAEKQATRRSKPQASFGSPYVRTYRLVPPEGVVDHETGLRADVDAVLDGGIDEFINSRRSQ